jgi:hypothetical protein
MMVCSMPKFSLPEGAFPAAEGEPPCCSAISGGCLGKGVLIARCGKFPEILLVNRSFYYKTKVR